MLGSEDMMMLSRRIVLLGAFGFNAIALAKDKKKEGKKHGSLGILAGTVFHPSGLSLPGAKITVYEMAGDKAIEKTVTDGRGEFAIRVPASIEGIQYRLMAEAKGLASLEREVYAYDSQRTTTNFRLKPER